jgi:DNA-directed RNA polymerase II subunit RPB11
MSIEINYDKNIQNTLEIKIDNETHSLGSALSEKLGKDGRCLFSSYKVLHPKDDFMYLRVGCDNTIAVKEYIVENLKELESCTQDLLNQINNY